MELIFQNLTEKFKENFKNLDNIFFETCNVLKTNYFNKLSDNFFDVIIVRNHLLNIPFSSNKIDYVEKLKQKSKCLISFFKKIIFKQMFFMKENMSFYLGKIKEYNLKDF